MDWVPRTPAKEARDTGVYAYFESMISIGNTGSNSFINCPKILVGTKRATTNATMQMLGEVKIRVIGLLI